jgi:hypothetical protein
MENRSNSRTTASINLLIYKFGVPVALGVTRDISSVGMFMQTSYVNAGQDPVLEFELLYSRKGPGGRQRYRALITEQRDDGLVLEFDEVCAHDARKLAAMVEWVAYAHEKTHAHEKIYVNERNRNGKTGNGEAIQGETEHEASHHRATSNRIVTIPAVVSTLFDKAQS